MALASDRVVWMEDGRIVLNKEDAGVPVAEIPTADVVEVVRCKDCRYECGDACLHALGLAAIESPECYCAYGERKEKTDVE